ncbi:glycoside hydrolase family 15 protein [Caldiplasma sukawensis]
MKSELYRYEDIFIDGYPKISAHGYIANNRTGALIAVDGTVDWLCLPDFSSDPVFDKILDKNKGGYFFIRPKEKEKYSYSQEYDGDTLILKTWFYKEGKPSACITDFMPSTEYYSIKFPEIHRIVESFEDIEMELGIKPTINYMIQPLFRKNEKGKLLFEKGNKRVGLFFSSNLDLLVNEEHHHQFKMKKGEKQVFVLSYQMREDDSLYNYDSEKRLEMTMNMWKRFSSEIKIEGKWAEYAKRAAIIIRGMFFGPNGMMVAAPTTSLPECIGGERNWDYRFSWIRDTSYVIEALSMVGLKTRAINYLYDMVEIIENEGDIKVLYPIDPEQNLKEMEIDYEGYRKSNPVRIGNLASEQFQLDVYGSMINAIEHMYEANGIINSYMWDFVMNIVEKIGNIWKIPDSSIWEFRTERKHYVYSKVMCWLGVSKAIKLGRTLGYNAPYEDWENLMSEIKSDIMEKGVSKKSGSFVQFYGSEEVDASLLRIPLTGFISPEDPIAVNTLKRIENELMYDGFLFKRYKNYDGLSCEDNAFVLMSFWYAELLIEMGYQKKAEEVIGKIINLTNGLGIISEEIDIKSKEQIGNFPQAISMLGFIRAISKLNRVKK